MKRLLFYIFVGTMLMACGKSIGEREKMTREERARLHTEDSLSLKFAVMPTLDCMPFFLAKEKRMFDTLGVDVRLRMFSSQMDCDTAFMGGSVEGIVSDLIRTKRMSDRGTDLQYISSMGIYWQLISNRRTRMKDITQFGDKMIAMTRYSATDYLCDRILDGVKTSSIVFRIQVNDVNIRLKMLLNNEMDAAWLPEPYATEARLHGHHVVGDSRKMDVSLGVMALRKKVMADSRRQKQIASFIKAYDMACDSLNKYGIKAYPYIVHKYFNIDKRTLNSLPKIQFGHIEKPKAKDMGLAVVNKKGTQK